MNYERDHIRIALRWLLAVIIALIVCGFISMLTSCKTRYITQEVPVLVEHTSVQHHTDIVRDTLMMRDSVFHFVQGDTTIIERWHYQVKIEKVAIADTIRDTIPSIVTVTKTEIQKVNEIKWWQKSLMWLGGVLAVLVAGMIGWTFWRIRH